jgi:hypothetical protein
MRELFDLIVQYPVWVKLTVVGLAALIILILVVFYPKGTPVEKGLPMVSPTNGVPVGRALFLDISQGQEEWHGLTAWAEGSGLKINLLRKPFEAPSFSEEAPGVFIFPLPFRQMLDDKKAAAIKRWVERGGGLLVLGYYAADSHHGSNVSRLIGEWNITFNDDLVMPSGASEHAARRQAFNPEESLGVSLEIKGISHPIVFGVNRVVLLSAASLDVRRAVTRDLDLKTPPSSEIWRPEGPKDPKGMRPIIEQWVKGGQESAVVLTSFQSGKGKVAVVGTWKLMTLPYGDNRKLVENLIDWVRPR